MRISDGKTETLHKVGKMFMNLRSRHKINNYTLNRLMVKGNPTIR